MCLRTGQVVEALLVLGCAVLHPAVDSALHYACVLTLLSVALLIDTGVIEITAPFRQLPHGCSVLGFTAVSLLLAFNQWRFPHVFASYSSRHWDFLSVACNFVFGPLNESSDSTENWKLRVALFYEELCEDYLAAFTVAIIGTLLLANAYFSHVFLRMWPLLAFPMLWPMAVCSTVLIAQFRNSLTVSDCIAGMSMLSATLRLTLSLRRMDAHLGDGFVHAHLKYLFHSVSLLTVTCFICAWLQTLQFCHLPSTKVPLSMAFFFSLLFWDGGYLCNDLFYFVCCELFWPFHECHWRRPLIAAYWFAFLGFGFWNMFEDSGSAHVSECQKAAWRKWFHLWALLLFVPVLCVDFQFLSICFVVALCIFLLLETARASRIIAPFSDCVNEKIAPFLDARDSVLVTTHIWLLAGCALPVWHFGAVALNTAVGDANSRVPALDRFARFVCLSIGTVVLGVGDAIAALVGSRFGRIRLWDDSQKTLEGTVAGIVSSLLFYVASASALQLLEASGWLLPENCAKTISISLLFCVLSLVFILEAITLQIDNLYLPLFACLALDVAISI